MRDVRDFLVRNYGKRSTLVCAASTLRFMGARSHKLMEVLEKETHFTERWSVPAWAYMGIHTRLDRAIQKAAHEGGIAVRSKTHFVFSWQKIVESIDDGIPVVLNCYCAPSGRVDHSVLAVAYEPETRRLLTVDPDDGMEYWMAWRFPWRTTVCTATFIQRMR